ncbi:MAG: hypothetical protein LBD29_03605 [Treponema sp.]|jgi:hypothetical protein|nr:hypothetical protein [Treponema sp.]
MKETAITCDECGEVIGTSQTWGYDNGKDDGSDEFCDGAGVCKECGRELCADCGGFDYDGLCLECRDAAEQEEEAV